MPSTPHKRRASELTDLSSGLVALARGLAGRRERLAACTPLGCGIASNNRPYATGRTLLPVNRIQSWHRRDVGAGDIAAARHWPSRRHIAEPLQDGFRAIGIVCCSTTVMQRRASSEDCVPTVMWETPFVYITSIPARQWPSADRHTHAAPYLQAGCLKHRPLSPIVC